MINFDAVFFSQGVLDMCYFKQMLKSRSKAAQTSLAPISVGLAIFCYALFNPLNYTDMGHLFFYPLYTEYWL
jgi:hypothetical protein